MIPFGCCLLGMASSSPERRDVYCYFAVIPDTMNKQMDRQALDNGYIFPNMIGSQCSSPKSGVFIELNENNHQCVIE